MRDIGQSESVTKIASLRLFQTATLYEVLGKSGAMPFFIKPLYPGMRIAGRALTASCLPGDNLTIHAAIELARPGDVLVIDFSGEVEAGPFGDILATACVARGITGLVIDGCVRDGASIREMGFPVFGRGLNMKGTTKTALGTINKPIVCAGVSVTPGDIIIGDDDGIVVIPLPQAAAVIMAAKKT